MKLLVSGTKYPDEHAFAEVYEGEDEAQLYVEIARKHSYNQFGDDHPRTNTTAAPGSPTPTVTVRPQNVS